MMCCDICGELDIWCEHDDIFFCKQHSIEYCDGKHVSEHNGAKVDLDQFKE